MQDSKMQVCAQLPYCFTSQFLTILPWCVYCIYSICSSFWQQNVSMPHEQLPPCSHNPSAVWELIISEWRSAPAPSCLQRVCVQRRCGGGLGLCSGSAPGELQDVHLAAGHKAHYHSRTWSHQRTEERANILLKCHCQQACERTCVHIHTKGRPHTHSSTH